MNGFVGIEQTIARQARAADPALSVFVSANAGSGKTYVLTERVVRLLLTGAEPSKILCLTYTKAAAAEMADRVFRRLSAWAVMPEAELAREIARLDGVEPGPKRIATARQLFAEALETPGGLKIQTIHAFCEAILHQFPLEANVPGHFEVMDDLEAAALLGEARRRLITGSVIAGESRIADALVPDLASAFATVLSTAGEFGLDQLLGEIVAKRDPIRRFIDEAGGLRAALDALRRALGIAEESEAAVLDEALPCPFLSPDICARLKEAAVDSSADWDKKLAVRLERMTAAVAIEERFEAYCAAVLDSKGTVRRSLQGFATVAIAKVVPDMLERVEGAGARALAALDKLATLRLFRASAAALVLADALERDYTILKRRRVRLDFEDLIVKTADLLTRVEASAWVHYKLDQGIDHVLVDEAQDTSPRQWQVMRALTEEFFAGAGGRNLRRTLFAVGDEKQSIYSFQGASPGMFAEVAQAVAAEAKAAGLDFAPIALTQSFRTAASVLAAVDTVFADTQNRTGLTSLGEAPSHQTARGDAPGMVEIWPVFAAEKTDEPKDWLKPIDEVPANAPTARLAARIADTIQAWLGTPLRSGDGERALTAGDILILVRKRTGFVGAMTAALRERRIPVAGADRLVITDHIAVKDLLALGRTVANVEDDLSLAEVLKSPFFNFTDDELMGLALSREDHEPLSRGLRRLAGPEGPARVPPFFPDGAATRALLDKVRFAIERIDTLRNRAGFETIFAFYARILGPEGGRAMLTARLGRDAGEVIDAFLDEALQSENEGEPGLDAFLARLAASPREIKRELEKGRGEVRIMTTHASKGLEAPVVFLVDPGSAPFSASHGAKLMEWPDMPGLVPGQAPGFLWCPSNELRNGVIDQLKEAEKRRGEEEYRRLLYVGMTRAADRLVICGTAGTRGPNAEAWLQRVQATLEEHCEDVKDAAGETIAWRFGDAPASSKGARAGSAGARDASATQPTRTIDLTPLPPEVLPPRPLSPSTAGGLAPAELDPEAAGSVERQAGNGNGSSPSGYISPVLTDAGHAPLAIRRGLIVHRLLQVLPDRRPDERAAAGRAYIDAVASDLPAGQSEALLASALAIMADPAFAPVFLPGSRPEVAIRGEIELEGWRYSVNGSIDRLVVQPDRVLIVDYKTNRPPPTTIEAVPGAYILQLALYRQMLRPLYPSHAIEAALVFTEAPSLIPVPSAAMDAALAARRSPDG